MWWWQIFVVNKLSIQLLTINVGKLHMDVNVLSSYMADVHALVSALLFQFGCEQTR